jgi:predicted permease
MLRDLILDIRFALRSLKRSPAFAATALLTIALSIGASTAVFSIVNGVLLRPLPYPEPDRLVRLYEVNRTAGVERSPLSFPDIVDWRAHGGAFASIAGYGTLDEMIVGRGDPFEAREAYVTSGFFRTLGAPVAMGRALDDADEHDASRVVVVSDDFWRTRLGGSPDAIGTTLSFRDVPFTVVGVAAPDFRFPAPNVALWTPQSVLGDRVIGPRVRDLRAYETVARLAPGVTLESAEAEANAAAAQIAADYKDTSARWDAAAVVPLKDTLVGHVERALVLVLALVGFILLIACANVAHLMLARGAARAHEVATRMALGADRLRVARLALTESCVLSVVGGALGVALALLLVKTVLALSAGILPRVADVRLDLRVLAFAFAASLAAGALFGSLPAWRMARSDPRRHLGTARGAAANSGRVRRALVVGEVALAVVLVVGAGLMARSFLALRSVDPGFDAEHVLTATLNVIAYPTLNADGAQTLRARRREIIERVQALPGVTYAATTNRLPLRDRPFSFEFRRADGSGGPNGQPLRSAQRNVSPEYFRAMGIPLLEGATLGDDPPLTFGAQRDSFAGPRPLVVSASAAAKFWPGEDPIGKVVAGSWYECVVVGVVGDVREALAQEAAPMLYMAETPQTVQTLIVRTTGDPALLAGPIRELIRGLDVDQSVRTIDTLNDVRAESIASDRFFTFLYVTFGALALALAAVGVYGVVAYSVGLRTQEIGVRIAVGARAADILGGVIGQGLAPVLGGAALGSAAALVLARLIAHQLYSIGAADPVTFVAAPGVLVAVALVACYVPARRATKIDPVAALRSE